MILNTLKAGVVALALAGTALVAVPAQAASPTFGFSLNLLGGGNNGGIVLHFGDDDYWDYCSTNKQIAAALKNKGYYNLKVVKEDDDENDVWFLGKKNGHWYLIKVDRCSHKVVTKEVHPIDDEDDGLHFNFSFTF
jgi:hypothetical protein